MKSYFLIFACFGLSVRGQGQDTLKIDSTRALIVKRLPAESYQKNQVAHLSDFVRRFNNQTLGKENQQRRQQIADLFDATSPNENLKKHRGAFIETTLDTNAIGLLSYPPKQLWAEFKLWVSLNGQAPQPVLCRMRLAKVNKGYAWQWVEAQADFLKNIPAKLLPNKQAIDSTAFVAPNAHETAFLDVFNLVKYRRDIRYSLPNAAKIPPAMAYLNQLIASGKLGAAYTEPPRLYVAMGKMWVAALSFQNHHSDNSGWLIENLYFLPNDLTLLPNFIHK